MMNATRTKVTDHDVQCAVSQYEAERTWFESHGGSLEGYRARYGDGGTAKFEADRAGLERAELTAHRMMVRWSQDRRRL